MELYPLIEAALKEAKRMGARQVEAYAVQARGFSAYLDDGEVKSVESKMDSGIAVRLISSRRFGQSSSIATTEDQARDCARAAIEVASLLPEEKVFTHFPTPMKGNGQVRSWDKDTESAEEKELAQVLKDIVAEAAAMKDVKVPNGMVRVATVQGRTVNTEGVDVGRKNTMVYSRVTSMTTGSRPGEGSEMFFSSRLKDLDAGKIGRDLRARAVSASKAVSYKGRTNLPVIIPPSELFELFSGSVSYALSAENVNRRRSPWSKKVGQEVVSKLISLTDDPYDQRAFFPSNFDDEGTLARRKELVKGGVLNGFMSDAYNAQLAKGEGTGNGLRRRTGLALAEPMGQYLVPVMIAPMNLVLAPGNKRVEEIVAGLDRGLVVEKFSAPEVHPLTGNFGLEVRCGLLVEKSEVVQTINHCLVNGNMFEALKRVEAVANDVIVQESYMLPSVCFEGLDLVGGD